MSGDYELTSLCEVMDVSRSGYYRWVGRHGESNRYEINRALLSNLVIAEHKRHRTYGYRHLAKEIRIMTGWHFSNWLCHKVCKALKIRSIARKPRIATKGEESLQYPNLVQNQWVANGPFEIVVSDTTQLHSRGRKLDLNLHFDTFNNEIVAYDAAKSVSGNSQPNHLAALRKLLACKKKRGYAECETILHTDQGTIYGSHAYAEAHRGKHITQSMSRAGTPTDNPIAESMIGWIKDELYKDFGFATAEDPYQVLKVFVYYFNNLRLAYSLGYKTPVQYRTERGMK